MFGDWKLLRLGMRPNFHGPAPSLVGSRTPTEELGADGKSVLALRVQMF